MLKKERWAKKGATGRRALFFFVRQLRLLNTLSRKCKWPCPCRIELFCDVKVTRRQRAVNLCVENGVALVGEAGGLAVTSTLISYTNQIRH